MSPRRTSLEAYRRAEADGILKGRRLEAYQALFHHGPMTAQELVRVAGKPGLWKRLSELREMGAAVELGERVCNVTGELAIEWDVTDQTPVPMPKKTAHRVRCPSCEGRGFHVEEQLRLLG
jgi:hypothetical protein